MVFGFEDVDGGDGLVNDGGKWPLEDGIEASGLERDSEDMGLAFEEAGEFAGLDAVDFGGVALEDEVDAGVRQGLRISGWKVAHVPGDDPIVFDEQG